ncbi:GspH/FimT family pseudopilin [Photobacterium kishitanii]|uniref:Type II secretion system protein H n=1 Tax=Photobacterium kishitanii TaxID=318456 RepID=A0AAX0YQR3_9GAMM|nr:GspH/FimT family pseudopilin [Photobacterium kishitanii]PSX16857.1 prepilin-type cleavage/methylation domain-containing protein [Photobacterium kishitanii]PSX26602.1 prepilin-type cleavage/methylation domain-containing protein [Photobacterium kishitanii]PSX29104.1 prepilin-type cleavage/methylation domain-containing protein [Photobacterium kishitanii]PSX39050.1 prepilin-type cleavage/methylation domain-containing protein [Photobacterium kishitanii]
MNKNGFTLLELIIAIIISAIALSAAAPRFHGLIARKKVERTVTELKGLFIVAKSEAVMRNKEVYLHTVGLTDTKTYTDDWCVLATTEPTDNSCTTNNNTLYIVNGHSLTGLNIKRHEDYATIKIDSMNGHPKFNAGEGLIDWLTFEIESGKAITMQMHMFGRLYQRGMEKRLVK